MSDEGRYRSDVRTFTAHEAYCSCGWSAAYLTEREADAAADNHDDAHADDTDSQSS